METERRHRKRQKNVNEGSSEKLLFAAVFVQSMYLSSQRARKADCLSEYVGPLIFKKDFLYYDSTHAGPSSNVVKIAKWTFFRILLDWARRDWA